MKTKELRDECEGLEPAIIFDQGLDSIVIKEFGENSYAKDALYHLTQRASTADNRKKLTYFNKEITNMQEFIVETSGHNAFVNDDQGFITSSPDNNFSGRYMLGLAFDKDFVDGNKDEPIPTVLAFTENNGLRNVGLSDEGDVFDIGPVITPTIIGTPYTPDCMVVPIHNIEALETSKQLISNMLDKLDVCAAQPELNELPAEVKKSNRTSKLCFK